jgi:ADP-ribose pyrophosphatase
VYQGRIYSLRVDMIEIPSGGRFTREVFVHPGAIVVVPVDDDGNVLFVRQYRRGADETLLELPAGTLGVGEDPDVCAARELEEETNRAARSIVKLGGFFSAPGFCTEYLHCYLATGLSFAQGQQDEDESVELVPVPLAEARQMIATGELRDAKTLAGLCLALPHLGDRWEPD